MLYWRSAWAYSEKLYSTSKWADFKPYGVCRESRDEVPETFAKIQPEIRFTSSNRDFVATYANLLNLFTYLLESRESSVIPC